jgi:2-succinyl-6-hydroxy-2,4-cyclohexadiene-1-carboxylate synthase
MKVIALHGFLGTTQDFVAIDPNWHAVSLSSHRVSFDAFPTTLPQGDVLVGYSLGARLALHALISQPDRWRGAVIISGHPGLDPKKREKRLIQDSEMAEKFIHHTWQKLVDEWNQQPIFSGHCILFKEKNYQRDHLAWMLKEWSLGKQQDLKKEIKKLNIPLLWVTGERDEKFCKLSKKLTFSHPKSEHWICPGAGHRVIFESPQILRNKIKEWSSFF